MASQEPHGRLMRAAAALAVAAAVIACGGSQQTETAPEPAPTAKQQACNKYGLRMAPFMRRFDAALDVYVSAERAAAADVAARADAARALASFIDDELPGLQAIDSADAELAKSHRALVASLETVGPALEQLAIAYVLHDREVRLRALARRDEGLGHWSEASRAIVTQCRK